MRSRMTTTTMRAAITATGHYLPPDVYPNAYFERRLDTTDAWIQSRTGIAERRFASAGGTSDLIAPAARHCLGCGGPAKARGDPRMGLRPGRGLRWLRLRAHRGDEAHRVGSRASGRA